MIEFTRMNIGNEKTDSGVTANLSNCNIYSMEKQNTGSLLKFDFDRYSCTPLFCIKRVEKLIQM